MFSENQLVYLKHRLFQEHRLFSELQPLLSQLPSRMTVSLVRPLLALVAAVQIMWASGGIEQASAVISRQSAAAIVPSLTLHVLHSLA